MGIIWTIIIGFMAGVIAKFVTPGKNEPSGFILTTILGIVGAFVASFLGQSLGFYAPAKGRASSARSSARSSCFSFGDLSPRTSRPDLLCPLPLLKIVCTYLLLFTCRQISLQIQRMLCHPSEHYISSSSRRTSGPRFPLVCRLTVWVP